MPPCTCVFSWHARAKAGRATLAATALASSACEFSSSARAASQAAAVACSASTRMFAQRCFTAWNVPIVRPNWTRTFAYSAAISLQAWAAPAASAAASVRPMRSAVARAPHAARVAHGTPEHTTSRDAAARVEAHARANRDARFVAIHHHEVVADCEHEPFREPRP
jgi:hypothetical protein